MDFLADNHINYVTRGPNTRRGEVSVKCPMCGEDDPSEHLGISLTTENWGCHRNAGHRGKSPFKLVQALLGCSYSQAKLIVGQYDRADPETLEDIINALEGPAENGDTLPKATPLTIPSNFKSISGHGPAKRFWAYLKRRGFDDPTGMAWLYDLSCCTTGRWKDRIMIPVYRDGELLAWTGRALQNPVSAPRYLSTSNIIKNVLFNEDELKKGGKLLFITEGPFDALKMDWYGMLEGAVATCVFGTSITIDQFALLKAYAKRFKRVVSFLDADAVQQNFEMTEWVPNAQIGMLPTGIKDPGELTQAQVHSLCRQYLP